MELYDADMITIFLDNSGIYEKMSGTPFDEKVNILLNFH